MLSIKQCGKANKSQRWNIMWLSLYTSFITTVTIQYYHQSLSSVTVTLATSVMLSLQTRRTLFQVLLSSSVHSLCCLKQMLSLVCLCVCLCTKWKTTYQKWC